MLFAVSGVKNSGKTSLIAKMIPRLIQKGYRVATIKHDGHSFSAEPEDTDTAIHRKAGAYGSAVFSQGKFMVVKEDIETDEKLLISFFKDADIIILEGFKHTSYPKIEVVRKENTDTFVCDEETVIAFLTDVPLKTNVKTFSFDEIKELTDYTIRFMREEI